MPLFTEKKVVQEGWFAAVRCTDGRHWIDTSTISWGPVGVEELARKYDRVDDHWARHNPVVGFSRIKIETVED